MQISAVTLAVTNMDRAVAFYRSLGLEPQHGGSNAGFTTFRLGRQHLNLRLLNPADFHRGHCLVIFAEQDVDGRYQQLLALGHQPEFAPRDAEWGERYFHLRDPDGNQLSFAQPLD